MLLKIQQLQKIQIRNPLLSAAMQKLSLQQQTLTPSRLTSRTTLKQLSMQI